MFIAIKERRGEFLIGKNRESLIRKGLFYSGRQNVSGKPVFPPHKTKRPRSTVDLAKCPCGLRCPRAEGSLRGQRG